jgi:RNA polymerase sigma-70 factor (ECF subfamily)
MLFTWLCQICRHEISDWYARYARKQEPLVSLDDDPSVMAALESFGLEVQDNLVNQLALADMVQITLDYLPDNYGKALELKYLQGLSVKEIAKRLGIGRLAAQSMLARARTAFRKGFNDLRLELSAPPPYATGLEDEAS